MNAEVVRRAPVAAQSRRAASLPPGRTLASRIPLGAVCFAAGMAVALGGITACGSDRWNESEISDTERLGQRMTPSFEPVLRIPPAPGAAEPVFDRIASVELEEPDQEIFVGDNFRESIRVFDWEGRLLREFVPGTVMPGRRSGIVRMILAPQRVYVTILDNDHMLWFERSGEYGGSIRVPQAFDAATSTQAEELPYRTGPRALIPTRYGHFLATARSARDVDRNIFLLIGSEGKPLLEWGASTGGGTYWHPTAMPEVRSPVPGIANVGSSGTWSSAGDSMFVFMDTHYGEVVWYRVTPDGASAVRSRSLGWTPLPSEPVDVEAIRMRLAAQRGLNPSEFHVVRAEFQSPVTVPTLLSREGDVWVRRRTLPDEPEPEADTYLIIPFDAGRPPIEITVPSGFFPRSVTGDLVFGYSLDPDTDEQSVVVYRISW